ncbi:MAG: response regulator [Candidatus Eisenbacteria bacterium]|uniref:Response regulator n=1 Tax=Eiseniibacteriota bacterium TaxID=2212470 RepID=A0A849T0G6_UNCEI|nr:response regulator [Candidatus Eisenbacteria bacterium]
MPVTPNSQWRDASRRPVVLVIDDDRRVIDLLQIALDTHGFKVISACDGDEGILVAQRERPDLVVLDVRLPKRSGLEVCEALRRDPEDPQLPILMVSALADVDARVQGLARGADDYLVKPFSPRELVARLQRLLARADEARATRRLGREAEFELRRVRDDAKRGQVELQRARRTHEGTQRMLERLGASRDPEQLAKDYLAQIDAEFGLASSAIVTVAADGVATVLAARGVPATVALEPLFDRGGELGPLVRGLGRFVRVDEFARHPELRTEAGVLSTLGLVRVAPLQAPGSIGFLLIGDPERGPELSRDALELLTAWNEAFAERLGLAGSVLAQTESWLEVAGAWAARDRDGTADLLRVEAAGRAREACDALSVTPLDTWCVVRAVRLGALADPTALLATLHSAGESAATARILRLIALVEQAREDWVPAEPWSPLAPLAIVRAAWGWAEHCEREVGRDAASAEPGGDRAAATVIAAIESVLAARGLDPETREAIRGAFAPGGSPRRIPA